jgi:hypothetical protein
VGVVHPVTIPKKNIGGETLGVVFNSWEHMLPVSKFENGKLDESDYC